MLRKVNLFFSQMLMEIVLAFTTKFQINKLNYKYLSFVKYYIYKNKHGNIGLSEQKYNVVIRINNDCNSK